MKKINLLSLALIALLLVLPSTSFAATFNDVPSTHSNYGDVMYLLEKGVVDESANYGISDIVTREEVAVMVSKAVGLDGTQRETKFSDVSKSNPNSGYIQSAVEAGIINGYEDGTFKPNNKVTRGHMAAFIARAFDLPTGTKTFKDVPKGNTAYDAVSQLAAAGITTGYEDGTFKPGNNLTRAHISAFLARAIRYQESHSSTPNPTNDGSNEDKNEVENGVGKTRNNAAKINQTVLIDVDNWLDGAQKFELTLTDVVDGQEAWNIVKDANMFNDEPEEGMKYVLAKFKINVISLEEEPMDINHALFDAVSKNGVTYEDFFSLVMPSPNLSTELYTGATYEGWTYFMVDEDDSPKVVFNGGWDSESWFDLGL